jgi:hypothetical protein
MFIREEFVNSRSNDDGLCLLPVQNGRDGIPGSRLSSDVDAMRCFGSLQILSDDKSLRALRRGLQSCGSSL